MRGSTGIQHQSDCRLAEGDPSVIGQRDEVLGRSDLLLTALGAPGEPLGHALQHILVCSASHDHHGHRLRAGPHG